MSIDIVHKHKARKRRSLKTRHRIRELAKPRLCVHRSLNNIYAQVIDAKGCGVLLSASTLDQEVKSGLAGKTGNVMAAAKVGRILAERAVKAGVTQVAFDRSGFRYHGRIKALADAAREGGMQF